MKNLLAIVTDFFAHAWRTFRQAQRHAGMGHAERVHSMFLRLIVETLRQLKRNDATLMAAGVSYYAVLSLLPLIAALWGILSFFADSEAVMSAIEEFFAAYLPDSSVNLVDQFNSNNVALNSIVGLAGFVSLLWVGSALFAAVGKSINRAFGIQEDRPFYVARSRGLILATTLFITFGVSVYGTVAIEAAAKLEAPLIGELSGLRLLAYFPPFLLSFMTFTIAYKFLPNTKTKWAYVWPSIVLGAVTFEAAKALFAIYLNQFASYDEVYGQIASVVALMVWSYTSAMIVIVGANVAAVYTRIREGLPAGVPAEVNRDTL